MNHKKTIVKGKGGLGQRPLFFIFLCWTFLYNNNTIQGWGRSQLLGKTLGNAFK